MNFFVVAVVAIDCLSVCLVDLVCFVLFFLKLFCSVFRDARFLFSFFFFSAQSTNLSSLNDHRLKIAVPFCENVTSSVKPCRYSPHKVKHHTNTRVAGIFAKPHFLGTYKCQVIEHVEAILPQTNCQVINNLNQSTLSLHINIPGRWASRLWLMAHKNTTVVAVSIKP